MNPAVEAEKMIFRKTNAHAGRQISITPANSSMEYLSYGRILLDLSWQSESFQTGDQETGLICLSGEATVTVDGQPFMLGQYDAIYIPLKSTVTVETKSAADLAEFSAKVSQRYPLQLVRFADVMQDRGLNFNAGDASFVRHLHMLLAKNVQAGRLIAGFTISEPGNWTSWPPHEHAAMLEEMYVYFNMPEPAFALQLVYQDTEYPELVTPVRDGDAVLMPAGYHPNVSVPGHRICFLWAMAARRESVDRQFGVVNVQKGFDQVRSGIETGR
jgi:5-deoxy-glucuronate isomerase